MKKIIDHYSQFLGLASEQYEKAIQKSDAKCKHGCHECCKGLFAITLLDAIYLQESLKKVPSRARKRLVDRAEEQIDLLEKKGVFSRKDPFLRSLAASDSLARRSSGMRCPALDDDNRCVLYAQRPLLCRVFGPKGSR